MKYILSISLIFSMFVSNAQLSGIPEQDSLLKLKDELVTLSWIAKNPKEAYDYHLLSEWTRFQWLQWVKGDFVEVRCKYALVKGIDINTGKRLFIVYDKNSKYKCFGDTLVKIPKEINYELFLSWKIKQLSRE